MDITNHTTNNLFDILSQEFSKEELIAADISSNIAFFPYQVPARTSYDTKGTCKKIKSVASHGV